MSETWTEYGWQNERTGYVLRCGEGLVALEACLKTWRDGERIVGRTVTASDWLPVDTDGCQVNTTHDTHIGESGSCGCACHECLDASKMRCICSECRCQS